MSTRASICGATGDEQAKLIGRMDGTGMGREAQSRHLNNNDSAADERVEIVMVVVFFFHIYPGHYRFTKGTTLERIYAVVVYII